MIEQDLFGKLPGGQEVEQYTLSNAQGLSLKVITYGGIVTALHVPDRRGEPGDVVLGFSTLEQYLAGHPYFGCIAGRVAGRITGGRFSLDGKKYELARNDPPNHLHGGTIGFDKRVWQADASNESAGPQLRLSYQSPDGEEGYPGNVRVAVTYALTDANEFVVSYEAGTDKPTPLSLTNHCYFNLAGEGSGGVEEHTLQIFADDYAPADEAMALRDLRLPVAGQANDFREPRRLGEAIPGLWKGHGDVYFVREFSGGGGVVPVARLADPSSGRVMAISSTERCVQLYTGVSLDGTLTGKSGRRYGRHGGMCLECEGYPNGANAPALGDIVLRPGNTYRQTTVHTFSTDEAR